MFLVIAGKVVSLLSQFVRVEYHPIIPSSHHPHQAYLSLGTVCAPRLLAFARFAGLAALRTQGAQVPPELEAEPLGALVTRVL